MLVVFSPPLTLFYLTCLVCVTIFSSDYLCSPDENIYSIDFTRFKIRDMETGTVLFEITKPPSTGEWLYCCLFGSSLYFRSTQEQKNKNKKLQIQTKIILLLCRMLMNQWTKMYWSNLMLYSFSITVFKHLIKRFSVEFEASLSRSVYVWPFHLQQSDLLQKIEVMKYK